LDTESFHTVILFGVIPAPMLPLTRLLTEMHRVLKPEGILAVWPPVPGWLPQSILQSGLFTCANKRNGVCNFKRYEETLETTLGEQDVADLSDVETAVLEIDGSLSMVPMG